jgi:hypothetical protein
MDKRLAAIVALSLAACGGAASSPAPEDSGELSEEAGQPTDGGSAYSLYACLVAAGCTEGLGSVLEVSAAGQFIAPWNCPDLPNCPPDDEGRHIAGD